MAGLLAKTVREEHLLPISSLILVWKKVAIYLGLSATDIEEIEEDVRTYVLRKHRVLVTWRKRNVDDATYQCLIDKAKENDDANLARKIETFLGSIPKQIDELQGKFSDLVVQLTKSLMANNVSIDDIILHIAFLPKKKIQQHFNFILTQIPEMKEAKSVIQLIMKLRWYMVFLDHSLLKEIIDKFANEDVKQKLSFYEDEVQHFCMRTSIDEFISCFDECSTVEMPENFKELTIMQNLDPKKHTLEDLENLRRKYASGLRLIECAMIFLKVKLGCVKVSWAIPTHCIPDLKLATQEQENMDFFADTGMTMVSVDGEVLYREKAGQSVSEEGSSSEGGLIGPAPPVSGPIQQTTIMGGASSPPLPAPPPGITKIDFKPHSFHMNSNGQYPSISMNNKGWIVQVYHKETVIGLRLRCRIGHLNKSQIVWSNNHSVYNKGFYPAIAINNNGLVVAVFASQVGRTMWYRVGQLRCKDNDSASAPTPQLVNSASVEWMPRKVLLGEGWNSTVALSDDNTVVVAYDSGLVYLESRYRIGDVRGETIQWRSNPKRLINSELTKHASVAINNNGDVAVGYSSGYTRTVHYTSGKIPSATDSEIVMSETTYTPPGVNFHPIVSINNRGHVVAVFHHLQGRLSLKIDHGTVKINAQLPCIDWSCAEPREFATNGYHASVSVNDQFDLVTSHKSLTLSVKKSIRNYVGHLTYMDTPSPSLC